MTATSRPYLLQYRAGPLTPVWAQLSVAAARLDQTPTREFFARDPQRFEKFSYEACNLLYDFSRQRLDVGALDDLLQLPEAIELRTHIEAMYRGEKINATEDRAVLHVALRQSGDGKSAPIGGPEIEHVTLIERERMLRFAQSVRRGAIRGSAQRPFKRVVNIGIGGSDLGPAMAVEALRPYTQGAPECVFVSNVDGCHLSDVLATSEASTTLFIIASKTFTTLETLSNARAARAWVAQKLGEQAVREHFAAVSVNHKAMDEFGVHPDYRFQMWDWVGGRYSLCSSIGVSLAIAVGRENFLGLLAGAHEMDVHFRDAPWKENLPVLMALLGIWNINFQHLPTLAVLPYEDRLRRFPAYLQQLEMESNGKFVTLEGQPAQWATAPVIWGEPGNNAQHSFFQLLHQGMPCAAMDFLLPVKSSCGRQDQQDLAIANCLAQAQAFMAGQSAQAVREDLEHQKLPAERIEALIPHKIHLGDRPSSILLFERLDPNTLGKLIALYEHKVFVQSVIWGINAFDQWGVELGKKLAETLVPVVRDPQGRAAEAQQLGGLLAYLARWR